MRKFTGWAGARAKSVVSHPSRKNKNAVRGGTRRTSGRVNLWWHEIRWKRFEGGSAVDVQAGARTLHAPVGRDAYH